jgi:streptomycin 3"-adenylyltransferase
MPVLRDLDRQQLARVVTLVREVLSTDAVGVYLFGSAVLGGLQSESDLDELVVSKRPITREEKQRLVDRLLAMSGRATRRGQWRRVELTIVVADKIRPWRYPPCRDFQYGDWLRDKLESGDVEPWQTTVDPDLALLITMVRIGDTPVLGPPPAEGTDPVPPDDLIKAMLDAIDSLRPGIHSDTRNVILTFARIWSTLATGAIRSKDDAANWVLDRLPAEHRPVLARARAIYLGEQSEDWGDLADHLEAHVEYVIGEIKRAASFS